MADDAEHSLLSASGSHGWIYCAGKIPSEEGRRQTSDYAEEGTAAHTLGADVLTDRIDGKRTTARDHIGREIVTKAGSKYTVDTEMAEPVDDYADACMSLANGAGALRLVEQRVRYAPHIGAELDEAWGTGDFIAALFDQPELVWTDPDTDATRTFPAGDELQIHDYKHGMGVRVDAPGNPQMRLYGLGALYEYGHLGDFVRVRMCIHQPRKDHFSEEILTVEELLAWAETVKPAVPRVRKAMALAEATWAKLGTTPEAASFQQWQAFSAALHKAGFLQPTDKGCRFCDGKAICAALREETFGAVAGGQAAAADFPDLTVDTPADVAAYGDNWMAVVADKLELIDVFVRAVRREIDNRVLTHGRTIDGFEVVQGRLGNRKFKDAGKAEAMVRAHGINDVYARKFMSPAQLEKKLAKAHPLLWADLQDLIHREPGAPSVARVGSGRTKLSATSTRDDFADMSQPAAQGAAAGFAEPHPFR